MTQYKKIYNNVLIFTKVYPNGLVTISVTDRDAKKTLNFKGTAEEMRPVWTEQVKLAKQKENSTKPKPSQFNWEARVNNLIVPGSFRVVFVKKNEDLWVVKFHNFQEGTEIEKFHNFPEGGTESEWLRMNREQVKIKIRMHEETCTFYGDEYYYKSH